jgi:hypothetical protein
MLIRPYIKENESFQSYVHRIAKENGWTHNSLGDFLRSEVAPQYSYKPEDRLKIKHWVQVASKYNEVQKLPDVWGYYSDFRDYFDFKRHKICPCCYNETNGVIPAYWFIRQYLVCIKHKQLLIDECQRCNEKLTSETFIKGECKGCSEKLDNFTGDHCEADVYSQTIFEQLKSINDDKEFISVFQECTLPVIKSLNVLTPLTGLEYSIGKSYWQRRFLTIENLYSYQSDCSPLYESGKELTSRIISFINAHLSNGINYAGKIFVKADKYVKDDTYTFYFSTLRRVLLSEKNEIEGLTVGLTWTSKLFNLDETLFINFTKDNYKDLLLKNTKPAISISNLQLIISNFEAECGKA